jgi:hypothetical protein
MNPATNAQTFQQKIHCLAVSAEEKPFYKKFESISSMEKKRELDVLPFPLSQRQGDSK